ncbi:hypothetical protein D3C87_2149770 [compost metagenome]
MPPSVLKKALAGSVEVRFEKLVLNDWLARISSMRARARVRAAPKRRSVSLLRSNVRFRLGRT